MIGADIFREEIHVFDPGALIAPPAKGAELGRIHVTARMQPRVSGGAVVNEKGDLLGIAVGGGEGRDEAIAIADLRRLIALRADESADERTLALGQAFAECSEAIEAACSSDNVLDTDSLSELRAAADNHVQLLEAGRVLACAGAFDAAADLHSAAVSQVPNSNNARMSLLVSLQLGARFEDMTGHARWLMEQASDDPQAIRFAIQSGVWGNNPDLAEAGYGRLLAADPVKAQAARRFIDPAPPAPASLI
ncbi:MAG: hypothetical protein AAF922_18525 [Pseudomonadota bacterium]